MKNIVKQVIKSPFSKLIMFKHQLGPLWTMVCFFILAIVALSICRISLMIWQAERISTFNDGFKILINGLRVDISSISYLLIIPVILSTIIMFLNKGKSLLYWFLRIWLITMITVLMYMEVITPTFILEYDLRPNRLFIEYLIYPKEVLSMLWTGYKIEILLSSLTLFSVYKFSTHFFKSHWQAHYQTTILFKCVSTSLVVILIFSGARSSLGHRPLNPAMMAFSTDHLLNDLTLNSTYSVACAIKHMLNEQSSEEYYGKMSNEKVISLVQNSTVFTETQFKDKRHPTSSYRQASYQGKPKNLVILLQESLGARYVGALGGLPLTPNLDNLMGEGWNFTNLYATGTRSVRGIEAVITGFTPTPARSVVKLDKSQENFFTIAGFLANKGYHTQFIYGGESHFDNMKRFFLGNGIQEIVDSESFNKIDFKGSWGASDEDLYDQAHIELNKLAKQKQPFFSLIFTSSNHSPYEFPDDKITLYDDEKNTRNNAVKYADYALGEFLEKAKKSDYWKDTIFLVVADHDSRVAGASLVPIEHFKIPGVILGENITPRNDSRLISQIDLAPTLLSLIGASGRTPMLGHDMTTDIPKDKLRAMMQYDKNFAYMKNDSVTILQPQKEPLHFAYLQKQLKAKEHNPKLALEAKANVIFGSKAYQNRWYQ